eukprot:7090153-Pyramimonas_sp.AAC.1
MRRKRRRSGRGPRRAATTKLSRKKLETLQETCLTKHRLQVAVATDFPQPKKKLNCAAEEYDATLREAVDLKPQLEPDQLRPAGAQDEADQQGHASR